MLTYANLSRIYGAARYGPASSSRRLISSPRAATGTDPFTGPAAMPDFWTAGRMRRGAVRIADMAFMSNTMAPTSLGGSGHQDQVA